MVGERNGQSSASANRMISILLLLHLLLFITLVAVSAVLLVMLF